MTRYAYSFSCPGTPDRALLGGKGADLAQMVQLGLPVPPGFTITTQACQYFLAQASTPPGLAREVDRELNLLETGAGRRFGDPEDPLLLAVRSGAATSMPGMMDTILDLGLNDQSVRGLAAATGDERFAYDCYRRMLQMFGETVFGVPAARFAEELATVKAARGIEDDLGLDAADLREVAERNKALCSGVAGRDVPDDPREQLDLAIEAVLASWSTERAGLYRRQHGIADDLGTAVNVQAMVYGNRGTASGSGVAFTRDPATGEPGDYGDFLMTAQGEDVVSGVRTAMPLSRLRDVDPSSYRRLRSIMGTLERHYRDMCDIEFTVEDGRLWILQTRVGQRSPTAAFRIAVDMVEEGWITEDEALLMVTGEQLTQLLVPQLDLTSAGREIVVGLGASPGAAVGRVALDSATAVTMADRGEDVILVRSETRPEDLPGMVAAKGVLTGRGGRTSHAAVVARGMGLPAVCGVDALEIDTENRQVSHSGRRLFAEGDLISLDGASGQVFRGRHRTIASEVTRWLEEGAEGGSVAPAVARLLAHADSVRRLGVRANADSAADVSRAIRFGADGIGLCRTEHMFLGDRRTFVERVLLGDEAERAQALHELTVLQREGFASILDAADGRTVTIRLLDAPLHEFLPDLTELAVRVAMARQQGSLTDAAVRRLAAVRRIHDENPMTGLRGVRLAIIRPELARAQVSAAFEAAADLRERGRPFDLELMVPLVSTVEELDLVARLVGEAADEVAERRGRVPYRLGTMVETPRAAIVAQRLAERAEFLSLGTNDLTQLTWGISRDDAERSFLSRYREVGVLRTSPFEAIDRDGVGALVALTVSGARATGRQVPVGVCGEHAGEPSSIHVLDDLGVDYVSCSPFRIPVARLEAGRAALLHPATAEAPGRSDATRPGLVGAR